MSDFAKKLRSGAEMAGRDPEQYMTFLTVAQADAIADYIESLEAEVERLTMKAADWQEVAKNENEGRKAVEARVKELEGVIRLGIDSVPLHWLGVARTALVREGDE